MTGQSSAEESAQAYAFESYQAQSGGPLMGFMTAGISTIVDAAKAVAAASEAGALQHDPEAIDSGIKKLGEFQAVLQRIGYRSGALAAHTPLGGGYAAEVGRMNGEVGQLAHNDIIPGLITAIDELKTELDKSRRSYRNVEESTSDTMNKL